MKSIYHMHIPKTGGRYLDSAVMSFLNYDCQLNSIDPRYALKTSHQGWKPVDEETFIFTTVRNPVERTISHYMFFNPSLWTQDISEVKYGLFKYLENPSNQFILDYQTKYICSTIHDMEVQLNNGFVYNLDLLDERLSRINIIAKTSEISDNFCTYVYRQSCDWLGIEGHQKDIISIRKRDDIFINDRSQEVIDSLTQEEAEFIQSINQLDMNLYNSIGV